MKSLWFYISVGASIAAGLAATGCTMVYASLIIDGEFLHTPLVIVSFVIATVFLALIAGLVGGAIGAGIGYLIRARFKRKHPALPASRPLETVPEEGVWPPAPKRPGA